MQREAPNRLPGGQFYGENVRTAQVAGALLTEYRYKPGFLIPKHLHEVPYIAFVMQGTYSENQGASRVACAPMSMLFQPAGAVHSEEHDASVVRIFSVQLAPQFLQRMRGYANIPSQPELIRNHELSAVAQKLYREFVDCDPLSAIAAEGYVLETLALLCRHWRSRESAFPLWLSTVQDIIHDHFPFIPTLAAMADEVNIHPAHLSRAFRRHFNCTIGEYARRLRAERAQQILAASEDSLSDVAEAVGYSDQSHFSSMFRRHTGFAPGMFRKLVGAGKSRARS
jgi:AraC family transcriptional regulator